MEKVENEKNLKAPFSFWFKAIRLLIFIKLTRPECRKFVRVCLLQPRATGEKNKQEWLVLVTPNKVFEAQLGQEN